MINGRIHLINTDNSAIIKHVTPMGFLLYLFQCLPTSRLYEAVSAPEVLNLGSILLKEVIRVP